MRDRKRDKKTQNTQKNQKNTIRYYIREKDREMVVRGSEREI